MLSPAWAQFKLGPLLRGESDARFYFNLFKPGRDDVTGLRKLRILYRSEKQSEAATEVAHSAKRKSIIKIFEGEQDRFRNLNGWNDFIHKELRAITRDNWILAADKVHEVPLGVHIRMGDFVKPQSESQLTRTVHVRAPLSWFVESILFIREVLGHNIQAYIFSDGKDHELKDVLSLENVTRVRTGSAISDLLMLSRSKILIGSGNSSFSAWAAFLGRMPTVAHPSQPFKWFNLANGKQYVGGLDPAAPAEEFIGKISALKE